MNFTIRLAEAGDAEALRRMNADFNGDTGVSTDDIQESLLSSPEIVVVAYAGDAPAGFCCAQVHHSFCYPAPVAEVTEMYVKEPFRRQGCARKMLHFLETHLHITYSVDELHLLTGCENAAAQAAYCRAGFQAKAEQYMTKKLTMTENASALPITARPPDVSVLFQFNGTRRTPAANGYHPMHLIREGELTTGVHHYEGCACVPPDGTAKGTITFIAPEAYPHCLHTGMTIPFQEGRRVIGQATILSILNPLLAEERS